MLAGRPAEMREFDRDSPEEWQAKIDNVVGIRAAAKAKMEANRG